MTLLRGSCLCGGVRFEISGPLMGVGHCHCVICRKAHSAAYRTRARVRREHFRLVSGEALVRFYESSPDFHRGFCGQCGSPVYNWNGPDSAFGQRYPASLETIGIAFGSLDDDPGVRPSMHYFVASKAPWDEITDELPQHAALPPLPPQG